MKVSTLATTTTTIASLILMLPALSTAYMVGGGFDMFGRPVTIRTTGRVGCTPPSSSSSQQEAADFYRRLREQQQQQQQYSQQQQQQQYSQQQQQKQRRKNNVDDSFDNLMREFNGQGPPSAEKQKEWVNRAFGMFSELNRDVATTEEQVFKYEEALRKQQKWANKVIEFASEMAADAKQGSSVAAPNESSTPNVESNKNNDDSDTKSPKERMDDPIVVTPRYSVVMNDETVFQVEVELPGVSLANVDIVVEKEDELLTIRGERSAGSDSRVTEFSKSFGLDPAIDTDKIVAKLTNGILMVTAPKMPKKMKEVKRIPITSGE